MITDQVTAAEFFAYRMAPPLVGFSKQNVKKGSTITCGIKGLSTVTVTMSIDDDGNYIFSGSDPDGDYIYVKVSKDNSSFEYVHIINVTGDNPEFDVTMGNGTISGNTVDAGGQVYCVMTTHDNINDKTNVEIRKNRFVMHSHGNNQSACYYFDVYKKTGIDAAIWNEWYECNPENCAETIAQIDDSYLGGVDPTGELYVTQFDKDGLVFSTLNVPPYSEMSQEAISKLNELGINENSDEIEIRFGYAFFTNGFGEPEIYEEDCQAIVNDWPGFKNQKWDIEKARKEFFPEQPQ